MKKHHIEELAFRLRLSEPGIDWRVLVAGVLAAASLTFIAVIMLTGAVHLG